MVFVEQDYKTPLSNLNKSLNGTSIDEYLLASESALQACSMILKKVDKKKDRTLILCHKHGLLDQLANCNDAALILHLAVLVIFTVTAQNMLHASGKHVSTILSYLQPILNPEQSQTLKNYHGKKHFAFYCNFQFKNIFFFLRFSFEIISHRC